MNHPDLVIHREDIGEHIGIAVAGRYGATIQALTDDTVIRIDQGPPERPGRGAARYVLPLSTILIGGPSRAGQLASIRHHHRPTWKAWRDERRDAYLAALTDPTTPHTDEVA